LQCRRRGDQLLWNQTELAERPGRPPFGIAPWGLGDDEGTAELEERCSAFGSDGRSSEGTRRHQVGCSATGVVASSVLCPLAADLDTIAEQESLDCLLEKGGAPPVRLDQDPPALRPLLGQHQSGHTAASSEIDGATRDAIDCPGERQTVPDVVVDRTWAEEPGTTGLLEHLSHG
jgi:hypothetical protein